MRVLVVGSGAREHALLKRLAGEPGRSELLAAPGNPGMAEHARILDIGASDIDGLAELARREHVDFTIVGPELPLSQGLVDRFDRDGLSIFGPTARAARLESSKAFAKDFMARHHVPTARYQTFSQADAALATVESAALGFPLVLKADGLAAGKGVVIAADRAEAAAAVVSVMQERRFGDAGGTLVLEECLTGPEVSFFVVSDGTRALPIGTAQDHKRIFDDDQGPNTGGMGAFAPSPLVDHALHERVMREIVEPVVQGMAVEGNPFCGFLYVGLMLTPSGPKVIEFNVRLGDPEAQVILPLVAEPLLPLLVAASRGDLRQSMCRLAADRLVGVVLASRGYPESSESGQPIRGLDAAAALEDVSVFHAGTARRGNDIVTAGGRVLTVVGRGADFPTAIARAYAGVDAIRFDGMQFRRDIGKKSQMVDRKSQI
jgi:phosphoribosylamine--glycine ligase